MAPVTNGRVLFNEIPTGYPEPGKTVVYDTSETIDLDNAPLNGGFLFKTLVLSIDPFMRGRMRDPSIESYVSAFILGQPINGFGVGRVLRSENPNFQPGQHVYGFLPHVQYGVIKETSHIQVIDNKYNLPWSVFVGAAGMPGKTAYYAWNEYAQAKPGKTAFVSTAAGAVGSFVVQLAKIDGLKVIGSTGSDDKVEFLKELGVDVVFNYKTTDTQKILGEHGGIDVYWDNVGGETLDAALGAANLGAIFIECGMISSYNADVKPLKNLMQIVAKSLHIHGFIVARLEEKWSDSFYTTVPKLISSGQLKYKEQKWKGLEEVGNVILAVQKGENTAKAVVIVADD